MIGTISRFFAWTILAAIVWLTVASCAFLWLAGLWDSPLIPAWSRPWQWIVYARTGDGSFSETLYLAVSAIGASTPFTVLVRRLRNYLGGTRCPSLYGKTGWADRDDMHKGGLRMRKGL